MYKIAIPVKLLRASGSLDKFQGLTVIHSSALVHCSYLNHLHTILTISLIFHILQLGLELDSNNRDPLPQTTVT